eukprot:jgi/Orpsp1_1/1179303/evm.model.c7180000068827.1
MNNIESNSFNQLINNGNKNIIQASSKMLEKKINSESDKINKPIFKACRICKISFKINCAGIYENTLLLGTDNGLHKYNLDENKYSVKNTSLISIRKYEKLFIINDINLIISKSGKHDILSVHDISHINNFKTIKKFENETKTKKIKATKGCINFSVEKHENDIYLCCLFHNSIHILKHDKKIDNKFLSIKDLSINNAIHSLSIFHSHILSLPKLVICYSDKCDI